MYSDLNSKFRKFQFLFSNLKLSPLETERIGINSKSSLGKPEYIEKNGVTHAECSESRCPCY